MRNKDKASISPVSGYSPHLGVLIDTLACCRSKTIAWLQDLTVYQLDFLYDAEANTIGALLLHLCALEVAVRDYACQGIDLENDDWREKWGVATYLGEPAWQEIRGYSIDYYLAEMARVRAESLA